MTFDTTNCRTKTVARLTATLLLLVCFSASAAHAQSFIRSPTLHVDSRVSIAPRISPGVAGRVRAILANTARDLGAPGRDDLFGAGEPDAYAAVTAAVGAPAVPVAAATDAPRLPESIRGQ